MRTQGDVVNGLLPFMNDRYFIYDKNGELVASIADGEHEMEIAAYIVRAVNAHERLVEALEEARGIMEDKYTCYNSNVLIAEVSVALPKIRAALALAKEE